MMKHILSNKKASAPVEYFMITSIVAGIVIAGFTTLLPKVREGAEAHFNAEATKIIED